MVKKNFVFNFSTCIYWSLSLYYPFLMYAFFLINKCQINCEIKKKCNNVYTKCRININAVGKFVNA